MHKLSIALMQEMDADNYKIALNAGHPGFRIHAQQVAAKWSAETREHLFALIESNAMMLYLRTFRNDAERWIAALQELDAEHYNTSRFVWLHKRDAEIIRKQSARTRAGLFDLIDYRIDPELVADMQSYDRKIYAINSHELWERHRAKHSSETRECLFRLIDQKYHTPLNPNE